MYMQNIRNGNSRMWLVAGTLALSLVLWLHGLFTSQILDPEILAQKREAASLLRRDAAKHSTEMDLAKAYWLRYEDVRNHFLFGENSTLGISGARAHFQQHGRREGRIYGPIADPADPEKERILAEAYWSRYPEVAESPVWGRKSALGIRGPRDHYRYIGRRQNMTWEEIENGGRQ